MPSPATVCSLGLDGTSGYSILESASRMQGIRGFGGWGRGKNWANFPQLPGEHVWLPGAKDVQSISLLNVQFSTYT